MFNLKKGPENVIDGFKSMKKTSFLFGKKSHSNSQNTKKDRIRGNNYKTKILWPLCNMGCFVSFAVCCCVKVHQLRRAYSQSQPLKFEALLHYLRLFGLYFQPFPR